MKKKGMKWSSLLLLILIVAMIATGCSSNSGDNSTNQSSGGTGKKTEILFWSPFSGSDGPFMKKIVDKYNSSQDQYKVDFVIHPNGEYYKQVDIALSSAKDKPSLMIMHVDKVPTYASKNQLQAIDDLAAEAGIAKADFAVAPVEYGTIEDKWYTIPLDIHPLVMYYNKDLFEQAGVTTVPTNRAEFDEAITKLTDASKGVYGYVVPTLWPQQFIFPTLVWQNGGQLWDGNDVGFNSPEVVEVVQYLRNMIEAGTSPANVQQDGENTLFLQGKNAIQFNGPWMKSQFDEAGLNYGVATVPQLGKAGQAVYAGSHGFVVPQGITDEKVVAGVGDFLKYVSSNSMDWAESGQALASIPMIESVEFKALEFQSTIASSFEYVQFSPNVVNWDTISEPIWSELNNALLGNKSVQEAMDDAVNKSHQAMK
ncbi:ABC transporter substrate-binding protein [Paenibacillus endoradicis]|uniref:ABC transporter substrate-binding protein n=1 Tax=Paenibacillus endoradicis TaxID=2972487 RepID=UPI0021597ED5|nr:ABC transporter substrate-binding protein [Paenibacillus endoradicis]MCR8655722.1 ABC transporter substrate-binding protein [Paenibacillus endoradicis]MCR8658048.1 ABC transporter substrate-binding protein [Paenibacillus endoradicis]